MDHHPPPTCPEHTRRFRAQCTACQQHRLGLSRRRTRAIAYGQWSYKTDAAALREHLDTLLQQEMTLRQIAREAGVGTSTVRQINRQRYPRAMPTTAARLLAVTPRDPLMVDSTGTARRLQALACAGYGLSRLARMAGYNPQTVFRWQRQTRTRVTLLTRDTIRYMYGQLWCTDGPDRQAAQIATANGWYPFEAWTDESIDDPAALPYMALEQVAFVDWEKLNRAKLPRRDNRRVAFEDLSPAEQMALWQAHLQTGGSLRGFRDKYRPVPIGIVRWLTQEAA